MKLKKYTTFEKLKKSYSYREMSEATGIGCGNICNMVNKCGFSVNALRRFHEAFPNIDILDMLLNYPENKE